MIDQTQSTISASSDSNSTPALSPPTLFRQSSWWKWLSRTIVGLAIMYLLVLMLLIINETELVYPGSKYPRGNWKPHGFVFEEIEFLAEDGTRLVGWYLPAYQKSEADDDQGSQAGSQSAETILLCHGNAENVAQSASSMGNDFRQTLNANVFVFDYRGFGKSEGTPSESGLIDDSEAALQWLRNRSGLTPDKMIIVGHSIGGGPAVHLAGKFGCKVLILDRTFNSLVAAAEAKYPIFPLRCFMQNQFRSDEKIANYDGPVFQSHGVEDNLIPLRLARKLFDEAPTTNKRFLSLEGMGHFDLLPKNYWTELKAFIGNVN